MSQYEYLSPKQVVASNRYPFSIGQMRHLLLKHHKNGLDHSVRKIGKRLMLRIDLFDAPGETYESFMLLRRKGKSFKEWWDLSTLRGIP